MEYKSRSDEFQGEPNHPQCNFFEAFPSSADPDETFYGSWYCHMSGKAEHAELCKGDYCNCPLAYGKSTITIDAREPESKKSIVEAFAELSELTSKYFDDVDPDRYVKEVRGGE